MAGVSKPRKNLTGVRFGRLVALKAVSTEKGWRWQCSCDCGATTLVNTASLTTGNTRSCGCLLRDLHRQRLEDAKGPAQREYEAKCSSNVERIRSMREAFNMTKQRCYNPEAADYWHYGGRGITICDRWLESFDHFLADMGLRPDGLTLERVDNDGPYSPDNCVWATRSEQANNTRSVNLIQWEGEEHTIAEWERLKGFKPGTLKARLGVLGYTVEEAFTKPVRYGLTPKKNSDNRQKELQCLNDFT